jgi:ribosomal protein S18 acetylase RimI-like enzyme
MTAVIIRPARPDDRDALYDICVRTADSGGDARGQWSTDDLMPDLFAGPYLALEPSLAFVADDGGTTVGYVVGARDTAAFTRRLRSEWAPPLAAKYAHPATAEEANLLRILFGPSDPPPPELAGYPAHLHIDLLPAYQRRGLGSRLLDRFLAAAGVPVHLGMLTRNTAARAFYDRYGFHELARTDELTYLGIQPPANDLARP